MYINTLNVELEDCLKRVGSFMVSFISTFTELTKVVKQEIIFFSFCELYFQNIILVINLLYHLLNFLKLIIF